MSCKIPRSPSGLALSQSLRATKRFSQIRGRDSYLRKGAESFSLPFLDKNAAIDVEKWSGDSIFLLAVLARNLGFLPLLWARCQGCAPRTAEGSRPHLLGWSLPTPRCPPRTTRDEDTSSASWGWESRCAWLYVREGLVLKGAEQRVHADGSRSGCGRRYRASAGMNPHFPWFGGWAG